MKPRPLAIVAIVAIAACGSQPTAPKPPPSSALRGVFAGDIERGADPCTDFFEFANGAWRKENPIPPSMTRWSRRWQSGESSKERLKVILDEVSARQDWPRASVEQLIGDFYGGCVDEARVNGLGVEPIKPILAEIEKVRERADLERVIVRLHELGIGAPFVVHSFSDLHAPNDVIAQVSAGGLSLPDRDYYVKTEARFVEARERYLAHLVTTFGLLGHDATTSKAEAATVMALETKLAQASLDNIALRDPKATDHKMTVAELQKLTPSFDWAAYFKATGIREAPLNVAEPAFMQEIERQLSTTSIADLRTYLAWQLVDTLSPSLSKPFVDESFAFYGKYLSGAAEVKPRWKQCVERADGLFGEALGQKYVEKYFPPTAKSRMQALVKNLLAAMHDTIDKLDWMSPATKKRALEKLATFNPKIGYPDKWKDYSSIVVRRDAYFASEVLARKWNVDDDRRQIGKPVDRGRWGITPPTSDAYYNASLNEIVFPAGILQPPAFSIDAADAVNYGAIGTVIGHEISHGFDDEGAQFDAIGRLNNWWTDDDLRKFRERGSCVVDQFEGYFIEPSIHHAGKLVLGESIGDLGGANLAYRAFQRVQREAPQPTLDGLSPDQQFFVAWGQFRGDATRPETQRMMIQGDPHPVAKFRVIGPLSNMPEFASAFSCKAGAAMVRPPEKRCSIW